MNIYLPLLVECSILSGSIPEKQPKICEYFQHRCILQMNKRVNIQIRPQEGGEAAFPASALGA